MSDIIWHLSEMLPYMAMIMPIHIIVRLIVIQLRGLKINWYHEAAFCLFVAFLAGLASRTVIPTITFTQNGFDIDLSGEHKTALIPFRVICYSYREIFVYHTYKNLIIDCVGNIVIFIPMGFFIPLLWKVSDRMTVAAGFFTSLAIEISQLFLPRWTDIDDIILNTSGTVLGLLLYKLLTMRWSQHLSKFKITLIGETIMNRKQKTLAFIVAIAIGFGLAMLAMSIVIYFGYTDAYASGTESLNVSLFGLDIYTLARSGEQYNGVSIGQNMGIICAGYAAVSVLLEQIIIRAAGRK